MNLFKNQINHNNAQTYEIHENVHKIMGPNYQLE
jgi:hypothetical protein